MLVLKAMADENMPKAGLRNSVRFKWRPTDRLIQRDSFSKGFLVNTLKLTVDDVYCLQSNSQERSYDVTFSSKAVSERVFAECQRRAKEKLFSNFDFVELDRRNFRVVFVHMYNPFVTAEEIKGFLSKYGEVISSPRKIIDLMGFWTGRTSFQMLLKMDPAGFDGLVHPPAFFNIGADRGFCFYSRQPQFCRRCRKHGHTEGACVQVACRFCNEAGHEAKDCPSPKACHRCGTIGHLYRDCPQRKGWSYAEAVVSGEGRDSSSSNGEKGPPLAAAGVQGAATRTSEVATAASSGKQQKDGDEVTDGAMAASGGQPQQQTDAVVRKAEPLLQDMLQDVNKRFRVDVDS